MLKIISWGLKIVPSIYYTVELMIFIRNSFIGIESNALKFGMVYVLPASLVLSVLLYFFFFRDVLERQLGKETDENESGLFTVKIQTRRMFRKYIPLAVLGILGAMLFYLYKPYIVAFSIKIGLLYAWFLLGEIFRIWHIGIQENKRTLKKLKEKKEPIK